MRKWFLIGGAGAVVGYAAVYFALDIKPAPPAEPEPAAVAAEPAPGVVDVADLDALLDARPAESVGAPFDATEPAESVAPTGAAPIPMAAD